MQKTLLVALIIVVGLFFLSAPNVLAQEPCTADFDCDLDVDSYDVTEFINQFGRDDYYNPCPDCYDSPCPCSSTVPKTGQTTQYATGDDGDLEKGLAWPNPRFTNNGDGTVTDNLTGLIWLKNADCFALRTWDNALSDSNGLENGECGLTDGSSAGDWRLPNYKELISLVDVENYNPALPTGHQFTNVQFSPSIYWTSTTYADFTNVAWFVDMYNGYVLSILKTDSGYVWPVRGPE